MPASPVLLRFAAVVAVALAAGLAAAGDSAAPLAPFVERGVLAGAVTLVADADGVLDVGTAGYSDVVAKTPMPPDAVFWIASQSKPITATALMMLVDEGKVGLDEPVSKYLPEFRDVWLAAERDADHVLLKRPGRAVTVRDLLRHTSGLPFKSALEEPTLDRLPLRVAAGSYAMTPLDYDPGTKYRYSNAGINTAGRIIEVVSGMPYERFLQTRLFDPLGMTDTTFVPTAAQIARIAGSYKPDAAGTGLEPTTIGQLTYPLDDPARQPMPAGGLFSTAADVAKFCRMILRRGELDGRRYVSEAAIDEMTRKQTPDPLPEGYGLGWQTSRRAAADPADRGGSFGHGGAYATNMTIDPGRGLVLVYMVQHAGFPGDGGQAQAAFRKAAEDRFGKRK